MRNHNQRQLESRCIYDAIFHYQLPAAAGSWPRVVVARHNRSRGSGESASFYQAIRVTRGGKRVFDGDSEWADGVLKKELSGLVKVGKFDRGTKTLYLVPPCMLEA